MAILYECFMQAIHIGLHRIENYLSWALIKSIKIVP